MKDVRTGLFITAITAGAAFASPAYATPEVERERSLTVGGAALVKPKYEGSDEHDVIGFPIIIPKFSDAPDEQPSAFKSFRQRVKFRGLDDIRLRAVGGERLQFGAVTGYITDRDQKDGQLSRGLGDVEGGLVLGGYTAFRYGPVAFDAAFIDKVTGDESGYELRFGAETEQRISERTKLVARVGTTFASDDYMQTYFGVPPAQASTSKAGLAAYLSTGEHGVEQLFPDFGSLCQIASSLILKREGGHVDVRLNSVPADSLRRLPEGQGNCFIQSPVGSLTPMVEVGSRERLVEESLALLASSLCAKFGQLFFAFPLYQDLQFV